MHHGGHMGLLHSTDEKPRITWSLLKRVLDYARPYWWHLIGMLVLILFSTGIGLISPLIFRRMIDTVLPSGDIQQLILLAVALLLLPLINGVLSVMQRRLNSKVGEGVIYDLRVSLFGKLQRMSLRFFTNTRVGELISRLNNDVIGAQSAISSTIVSMITNVINVVAILVVMLALEWRMTLLGMVILPLFIIISRSMGTRLRDLARKQMEVNAQMNAHMNETLNIGGALLVKLFGRANGETDRFRQRAASVRDMGVRSAVVGSTFFVFLGLVGAVGTALIYGLGGWFVIQGTFTIGTIVAFGTYLGQLYGALQGLASTPVNFSTSMVSFERVFEVLDLPPDIPEKEGAHVFTAVKGELEFDHVTFAYSVDETHLLKGVRRYGRMEDVGAVLSLEKKGGEKKKEELDLPEEEVAPDSISQARDSALEDISFHAGAGQLVALVGPSGAGKTTVTYLIPRLYDPTGGVVRLDGCDLRNASLDSLSSAVGMVTQEAYLFHDTIRTNITYARPDATDAEVQAAAQAANIHDFIRELPDGYDTIVGERGYRLSGGEKQRIALARVILKDPRILVLDEATSNLDSESESLIQEALKRVMADRTSIVIAHRLSTILAADLILVMDRGRIVERGTHAQLLELGGLYSQLYETQFGGQREM